MATIIQIKRSSATTAPATLKLGELALTYVTGTAGNNGDRLFAGTGGVDGNGDANDIDVIGGKYKTGKKEGSKACGRGEGEKRSKYPACRPTAAACKKRSKSWGKKAKKGKKG